MYLRIIKNYYEGLKTILLLLYMYPSAASIILVNNFYTDLKSNNIDIIFCYLKFAFITNLLIYNIFLSRQSCYTQVFYIYIYFFAYLLAISSNYTLKNYLTLLAASNIMLHRNSVGAFLPQFCFSVFFLVLNVMF